MLAMRDWLERTAPEQFCQLARINAVTLAACQQELIVLGIADHYLLDQRTDDVVEPGGMRALLEGDVQFATSAVEEIPHRLRGSFNDGLLDEFAGGINDGDSDALEVHIHADIQYAVTHRALLSLLS